jgi:hypothetical protein
LGAFAIDDEHNRINQYNLDVRWPQAFVVANPDAVKEFDGSGGGPLGPKIGLDLKSLLSDAQFREALRNGTFYKQHSDEPFQVVSQAVMFGYRPKARSPHGPLPFVVIRFPRELADILRFQPISDER